MSGAPTGGLGRMMRRLRTGSRDEDAGGQVAPGEARDAAATPDAQPGAIWTDSHCHLQDSPDPTAVLLAARAHGVGRAVCVGTDARTSAQAVALATGLSGDPVPRAVAGSEASPGGAGDPGTRAAAGVWRPEVWATVGLHPHDAKAGLTEVRSLLSALGDAEGLKASRVVAVGECGLDYYYEHTPRATQRRIFADQVTLAKVHGLALVIHTREAWDDTFAVLASEGAPERTVFHCFTGGPEEARRCLELGASLSFSGIVTFATAQPLRDAAAICPLDRLLVETDSPFLTPVPHRGRSNEPGYVPLVGQGVAAAKGIEAKLVADASWENAEALFGLGG